VTLVNNTRGRAATSDEGKAENPSPLPSPSLPKGGGAIRGIGEKFAVNPVTGTGSLTVPIAASPGRSGFGPRLSLSYDSGAGNGPFGFGWHMALSSITRKTDKGLPRYLDDNESDVFILSGAEDLVPVLDEKGARVNKPRTLHGVSYQVRRYRPRIEGPFARIERWTAVDTGISHFRSITQDNVTTLYGFEDDSRIASPADPRAVFSYLICRTFDDKGNVAIYRYVADDAVGVDRSFAHEANRTDVVRATQRYLQTIRYGNTLPYFPDWSELGPETALPNDWHFQIVFDFGDHATDTPTPLPDRAWPVRPDPFSNHRAGFEIRSYRRCQRVLVFHSFEQEEGVGLDCLVRSTDFRYSDQDGPTDPKNPIYTFLTSVTQSGYRRQQSGYLRRSMPPLEFEYSEPQIQTDVLTLDPESLSNLPEGLDGSRFQWVDLDGEGLSGILSDFGDAWGYKRNLSPLNQIKKSDGSFATVAHFGPLAQVAHLPSRSDLGRHQRLLDLSGDGQLDVLTLEQPAPGFFERSRHKKWLPFRPFASLPQLPWSEPNLKLIDVTGDGLADALLTEDGVFTFWPSLGQTGFGEAERVLTPWDEERGPAVVLADGTETIFLGDMTGSGMSDVVRVRNGEVCYWPNQGYGRFGSKVTMDAAPRFVDEARFDPRRVRLADIDSSGTTDLLYIGDDGVYVYFNRSGNSWAEPQRLAVFPTADTLSSVQVFDLLGNGTACLVWSSPLPANVAAPLRYVDLMGGQKPHLMILSRNNLGAETRLRYAPSTRFYLADEMAGKPWVTRLPHVVHVVERVETFDFIGRSRFVSRYAYHHGFYDGFEREFRGFGMVEQWDTEEHRGDTDFPEVDDTNWNDSSWVPPMLTRTWFHTGVFLESRSISKHYAHEYWIEPALRPDSRVADREAMQVPDSVITSDVPLSAVELQEACRALKGMALRIEVYAEDGSALAVNPYSVTEQNFTVECKQSMGINRHAVFYTHPRETIAFHYERRADDPRVTYDVTLETDPFGNVKRSVSIGYARRAGYPDPEPTLSDSFRGMLAYDQTRLHVAATENRLTNDLTDPAKHADAHRTPLPSESITAEWTGISPTSKGTGITNLFLFDELDTLWTTVSDGNHDIPYEEVPASDVNGAGTSASAPMRRIVEHTRTLYRKDDLSGLLAPDHVEAMAFPGESYHLALTPGLVTRIFGARVQDGTLSTDGGYVHFPPSDVAQPPPDDNWWIPSGRVFYSPGDADTAAQELAEARAHFFFPRRAVDSFGGISRVGYAYDLLPAATVDAVGNATEVANDYRVLLPYLISDPNGNRSQVAFDALGLVAGTAVMGKVSETLGDSLAGFLPDLDDTTVLAHLANPLADPVSILGDATTRLLYDLYAYDRTRNSAQPAPFVVYTLARETHRSDLGDGKATLYQHAFTYSDGFVREIQKKVEAEPGPLVDGGADVSPRWVGSGWTIFNNKGKPIRKYEPFFSRTNQFEFAQKVGVSSVVFYDSADRVVAMLHPNNTWEKVVFDSWRQDSWDVNDTVLIADPRKDGDVGDRFKRFLGNDPNGWTSWHDQRIGGALGDDEKAAAKRTEAHKATPTITHFDSLGRTCLSVADNGADGRYPSRTGFDTENKALVVFDALGRRVLEYCVREPRNGGGFQYVAGYDIAGNALYHNGMDGGERRSLSDVARHPIRSWDALGHAFEVSYDLLRRPTHRYVSTNDASKILLDRSIYGEGMPDQNLCGRLFRQYDTAGLLIHDRHDFKGNLVNSTRQLAIEYRQSVDWSALANLTDAGALDAAAKPLLIDADRFSATTTYDALNRAIQTITPHSPTMKPNVIQPSYNEANLLEKVDVWLQQSATPSKLLDPSTADLYAITNIDYNARGQRTVLALGNDTITTRDYDPLTFRLTNLKTTRPNSFPVDERVVQDLSYTHDPRGNVTHIRDDADIQNVVYFRNQRVEPSNDYTYDAIYRLVSATGREHLGQTNSNLNSPGQIADDDSLRTNLLQPGDGNAMGTYTESYLYDSVGNILAQAHQVASGAWTRRYAYAEPSQIASTETNNRLSSTSLPGDPDVGPYSAIYAHDAHGSMIRMPHLPRMTCDEQDRLRSTAQQIVNNGTPETTFYTYDLGGERRRKVTDGQAQLRPVGLRKQERIYLGSVEIYRQFEANGTTVKLERETLHVFDGPSRIALAETRTLGMDHGSPKLARYQYGNHLDSAALELDEAADIISYEEYFPFGSTAYQSMRSQTETPKRYRYTNKERDDETALNYHGARYYATWLGRWTAPDPEGTRDGTNLYAYVKSNPLRLTDPSGRKSVPEEGSAGLRSPKVIQAYVDTALSLRGTRGPGASQHVVDTLAGFLNRELDKLNIPRPRGGVKIRPEDNPEAAGGFSRSEWQIHVTPASLPEGKGRTLTQEEFAELAKTLYHEYEHLAEAYAAIRHGLATGSKATVKSDLGEIHASVLARAKSPAGATPLDRGPLGTAVYQAYKTELADPRERSHRLATAELRSLEVKQARAEVRRATGAFEAERSSSHGTLMKLYSKVAEANRQEAEAKRLRAEAVEEYRRLPLESQHRGLEDKVQRRVLEGFQR